MKIHGNGCVALMAMALSAGVSFGLPAPAHAANFFERLFGAPHQERHYRPAYNGRGPNVSPYARRGYYQGRGYTQDGYYYRGGQPYPNGAYPPQPAAPAPAPAPVVKVKKKQYYTYKPDELVMASLGNLTDAVTTGSVNDDGLPSLTDNPFNESRQYLADVTIRALPEVVAAIKKHYAADPHFIWVSGTSVNGKARAALAVLADAASVGLDPQDYQVNVPSDAFDMTDTASRRKALMQFEMQLSAAALTYALDAKRGRVVPDRLSDYHDMPRKKVDLVAALTSLQQADDAGAWLQAQNPQGEQFQELKTELATLRASNAEPQITIPEGTLIHPGESSIELPQIVEAIRTNGSDDLTTKFAATLSDYTGGTDYTPDLVALVRAFQKESGLRPDGVVGTNTVNALTGFTKAEKIQKVILAMERARWLPGVLPAQRVFVNEASFEAAYFDDNQQELKTRVIVGQKDHQTNFFSDQIETVEFNPYWGVPQSIIINEMLPKLRKDSSYLDRMGYQLQYKGKDISSTAVNWNTVSSTKAFSVRQPPGDDNALGDLKILFPNKHAIYLHDTPLKGLFKHSVRDFSHGCVRMQDPRGMAAEVLGISREKVADYISSGQNQAVPVPQKIPVYLAYFTAWPDAQGEVKFYDDVYDRDMYLERALDTTEAERHAVGSYETASGAASSG